MDTLTLLSLGAAGIYGLSLLVALAFAVSKLHHFRQPARWLLLGISLWLAAAVSSHILTYFLVHTLGPAEIGRYALLIGLVRTCIHALGLGFVVHAVFVDRQNDPRFESWSEQVPIDRNFGPQGENPFSAPRAS